MGKNTLRKKAKVRITKGDHTGTTGIVLWLDANLVRVGFYGRDTLVPRDDVQVLG